MTDTRTEPRTCPLCDQTIPEDDAELIADLGWFHKAGCLDVLRDRIREALPNRSGNQRKMFLRNAISDFLDAKGKRVT